MQTDRLSTIPYLAPMRALHWIVALGVLATWPLGMMIKFTAEPFKLTFYMLHESIGFLVLWVMLVRIGIRLTSETPVSSGGGPLAALARLVHALLYLMLVVMPVSGFLATNAHGFPLSWFGLFTVWSPIGKLPTLAPTFSTIHTWSAWILLALFALHIAGVLFHHLIKRDGTLHKML
ncbi:cytochrome B [Rhizobium sp. Root149]|uniref:cytochrome b n=1 Tax=Rhizobium sp. Root149 TaxID=1736473 RepID=UPI0007130C93|nr:cytochrome b [Rhizobium sp. Root149]KQZ47747.1 cytochrome B [Rhizobium sp. Root149]